MIVRSFYFLGFVFGFGLKLLLIFFFFFFCKLKFVAVAKIVEGTRERREGREISRRRKK